jgi:tRNA pseudouridine38-40 synthase
MLPVTEHLPRRMNSLLPFDLRVLAVHEVPSTFSARFHALAREYHYKLHYGSVMDPLQRRYSAHVRGSLDVDAMRTAAACMEGTHDFRAFANTSDFKTSQRTLYCVKIVQTGHESLRIEVCAQVPDAADPLHLFHERIVCFASAEDDGAV